MSLPISIGILSWHSGEVLVNTLTSYATNGLLDLVEDVTIFFQECTEEDKAIADQFGVGYIESSTNVGIGKAFIELAKSAKTKYFLTLEHDFELIEDRKVVENRLVSGVELLKDGYDVVKYRHRKVPGFPLFSEQAYKGRELEHYDEWSKCMSPHLLDCIHWIWHPEVKFKEYIGKTGEYFTADCRYANWTNNPCLYETEFYLRVVEPIVGEGIQLEENIAYWWPRQDFKVAHGEGLFTHNDFEKYRT